MEFADLVHAIYAAIIVFAVSYVLSSLKKGLKALAGAVKQG